MSSRIRKGFTIIELLVALGVTALLVTLMINVVSTVLTNWNRTSGTLSTGNQARLVLDQISQDLQGVILKTDSNVWLAASVQTTAPSVNISGLNWIGGKPSDGDSLRLSPSGASLEDYRFGQGGVWLRFFSIPSGENDGTLKTISAPRAISYQIVRRGVSGSAVAPYAYQLFRSEVYPNLTFDAGYDLYNRDDLAANTYNNTKGSIESGDKETIRHPIPEQVIASGIVDFGIRFFAKNSTSGATEEVFPVNRLAGDTTAPTQCAFATSSVTTGLTAPVADSAVAGATPITAFPTVAEVMIRVLTPEGIRLLEAHESGLTDLGDWWENIVIPNSNVYTRRIDLKATAL